MGEEDAASSDADSIIFPCAAREGEDKSKVFRPTASASAVDLRQCLLQATDGACLKSKGLSDSSSLGDLTGYPRPQAAASADSKGFLDPQIRRSHFLQAVQIMRERSGVV